MRVNQQAAYIMHRYDYRETSLLLDVFSRKYGRLALIAKGARRNPKNRYANLALFQPFLLDWSSHGDMGTLCGAEQDDTLLWLEGQALLCGFYVNEVLIKLLQRHDPHEALYDSYEHTLFALQQHGQHEAILRRFEKILLQELGYGLVLDHDIVDNSPIQPDMHYDYILDRGPTRNNTDNNDVNMVIPMRGSSLIAFAQDQMDDGVAAKEIKRLTRAAIAIQLEGRPLHCRRLFKGQGSPTYFAGHWHDQIGS